MENCRDEKSYIKPDIWTKPTEPMVGLGTVESIQRTGNIFSDQRILDGESRKKVPTCIQKTRKRKYEFVRSKISFGVSSQWDL